MITYYEFWWFNHYMEGILTINKTNIFEIWYNLRDKMKNHYTIDKLSILYS